MPSISSRRSSRSSGCVDFEIAAGFAAARALLAEQELLQQRLETPHTFAMLINDSLAMREEAIVSAFGAALGHVPLVGGSAGVSPTVREPNMFLDGRVLENAALMLLISTDHDFRVFQTQHFKPLDLEGGGDQGRSRQPPGDGDQCRAGGPGICAAAGPRGAKT